MNNVVTWEQRAKKVIAQGALTNSKRPESFVRGVYPTHVSRGSSCYVYDDKGRRHIDFICALGTNLIGYANRELNDAITLQLGQGTLFSLGSTLEVQFAERVNEVFPFVEKIKVLKSGTEGCSAAVRIARAGTGRTVVLSHGYHGWSDQFTVLTPPAVGVPAELNPTIRKYGSLPTVAEDTLAAIIVEPIITEPLRDAVEIARNLRHYCTKHKICLIFDETITFGRFPKLSFASYTGIQPDLIIFGKALANGLPISVVGGSSKWMDSPYFISTSFAGDCLALRGALHMLSYLPPKIDQIFEEANHFQAQVNEIDPGVIHLEGYGTRGVWKAKDELTKALFFQECAKAQILVGPTLFWCEPHREESQTVLKVMRTIISRIKNGDVRLEGEMPQAAYAQKVREES